MRHRRRDVIVVIGTAAVVAGLFQAGPPTTGQAPDFSAARLEGTPYPDFNGIWQALNTAHWDLEDHVARPGLATVAGPDGDVPAAPVLALGAIGGVPGGQGVVEDGSIPYQPWAAAERQ